MARRCLAKAIYDNVAETPNELAFRKGDVLAVISQSVPNLDGWWVCSFRGKQGIAPGNRLQLLAGMYPAEDGDVSSLATTDFQADYTAPSSSTADYDVPRALGRQEPSLANGGSTGGGGTAQSMADSSPPGGLEALYDALPPTRGIAAAGTPAAASPFRSSPAMPTSNHKAARDGAWQQQHATAIRDLTYDVPMSLQRHGAGGGVTDEHSAKKDALSRGAAATRELEYDIPAALARMRVGGGGTSSATPAAKEPSPPLPDSLYDVPPQHQRRQQQQAAAAGARASGFSLASSSTTSWSSSGGGFGAEGSTSSGTASARSSLELLDIYDVPRSVVDGGSWAQRHSGGSPATVTDELYDELPRGVARPIVGGSGGLRTSGGDSKGRVGHMKASVAAAADSDVVYDVPPQVVRDSGGSSGGGGVPLPAATSAAAFSCSSLPAAADGLPLQLDSAVELLVKLQQDAATALSRLLGLSANESWRRRHNLDAVMYDVKMACIGVQTNLQEFVDFARGACANVAHRTAASDGSGGDRPLLAHLAALLGPIEDKLQLINKSMKALSGSAKWQVSRLAVDLPSGGTRGDDLDTIVTCSQDGLADAVGRLSALIKANAMLIFRKRDSAGKGQPAVMAVVIPQHESTSASDPGSTAWRPGSGSSSFTPVRGGSGGGGGGGGGGVALSQHQEYDYIELDDCDDRSPAAPAPSPPLAALTLAGDRQAFQQQQRYAVDAPPPPLLGNKTLSSAERPYSNGFGGCGGMSGDDRQFLSYYRLTIGPIVDSVGDANGRLLAAIRQFEPAQRLVVLSKDVVVLAHRLVYIGETLGRSLAHAGTRTDVANAANELCNCLKNIIVSTKDILVVDQSQSNKALQVMISRANDVQRAVARFEVAVTRPIAT